MEVRSVCVVVAVMLLEVGHAAGRPVPVPSPPPIPGGNCTCGTITVVCSEAASLSRPDRVIPWVTFVLSVALILIPGLFRVWRLSPERLGIRHTFFMWYLILGVGDYAFWCWYSYPCKYWQATFPILLTSILGLFIHVLLAFLVALKLPNHVAAVRLLCMAGSGVVCAVIGGIIASAVINAAAVIGWLGLGLGVLSHFFRMKATDYDDFDWILFGASVIGTVNGFLWLHHPNLCVARQYKITSYLIAALRGFEACQWYWPQIGNAITNLEGIEMVVYAGNRNGNKATAD